MKLQSHLISILILLVLALAKGKTLINHQWELVIQEKYIAKLCHDTNDMKTMYLWDPSFLANQMQSASFDSLNGLILTKNFESKTQVDFTDDKVLITTQNNTSVTAFDFEIISFENCKQSTVIDCITFHRGNVDFLQFSKGKLSSTNHIDFEPLNELNSSELQLAHGQNNSDSILKLQIPMAKVLQNNTLMLVLSCESFKDQIVVVQFRGTSHSELVVSKLKKVDISISKVKALSVFSKFESKTENMLYWILVNDKGQIITLKITAHTFRIHLPGYELMSREQTEPVRSEIVRSRDHHGFTDYVSVINHYKGKTELVMMQIHNSSQFYSHTFHKEISTFSAYCYTQQYMMAFVQFSDGSSLKLHAKMKQDTDFEIRQDPMVDSIVEQSTSACLYNGFLAFANYSTSDLLKIHKATFANCQLNFTIQDKTEDSEVAQQCMYRMQMLVAPSLRQSKQPSILVTALSFVIGMIVWIIIVSIIIYKLMATGYIRLGNEQGDDSGGEQDVNSHNNEGEPHTIVVHINDNPAFNEHETCWIWMAPINESVDTQDIKHLLESASSWPISRSSINSQRPALPFNIPETAVKNQVVFVKTPNKPDESDSQNQCFDNSFDERISKPVQLHPWLHSFHQICLTGWLQNSVSCPICREDVTNVT